jgi:predicted N-formylglutamate amidohydrolase
MINEPGHPTGRRAIPEEISMLKTISAALLAISVMAAPAMAAGIAKTAEAPAINAVKAKPNVMNANASMGPHHHRFHRHHRFHKPFHTHFHKHVGANKPHQFSKVTVKRVKTAIKRG